MRFLNAAVCLVATLLNTTHAQQYVGDVIPNSLPPVPGSEITYFRIKDPSGKNNNLTLTNYYSHGKDTSKRLAEANVQRAVIIIHGLNRDPGTYMSNMLSALAQTKSDPMVNFDTVAIMAPYFANGDDKGTGYPWTDGLSAGKGSTSNALVWKASQWSAGGNNQYPSTSKNTSSYTVLDQIVQYFDNATLFPKMRQIVVAGHSLGGQTVQRYAALGARLNTRSPVSYWVGNPNSYVWLSTDRPLPTTGCPSYDDYREGYSAFADYPMTYGLGLVNAGRAAILANYNSKAINYGRGTQDLGDDSSTCAPGTTGKDRNERFFNFIKAFPPSCPDPTARNCDTVDFVNTGHDGGAMMASPAGQARLFLDNFYGNGNRSYDFGYPRQQAGDDPYPNPALNGTAASVNNNTYAGNMTYWGCWSDQSPQTLTNRTYESGANTIDLCTATCAAGNNSVAGMEFGTQCFCGSSLGYRAQQVIESSCQNTCPGNSSQTCGGYSRLSIFSNGRPALQPTPGTPETVGDFTYISCYTEASSGRALTGKGTSSNTMTLETCASYCSGFKYFGTEYGSECYCGNAFASGANRTSDDECNMLCANDPSEFCGAGNRLTVYQNANWVASSSVSSAGTTSTTSGSGSQSTAAVSCPASNNTVVPSGGKNFTIECGVDHQGGDLTSLSVSNFQGCIDACAQNSQCVDVSLSGSACYLKSVLGAAVQNGGIWGAKLVVDGSSSSSTGQVSISSTITASGSDARTSTTSAITSPSGTTSSSTSAVSISSTTSSATASSTPITCPASNDTTITSNGVSFLIECGIDHAGGDMRALSVSSFQQCIDACATTQGCVDLSLSGNACYLKSYLGSVVRNGVWGAKVVQGSSSTSSSTDAGPSSSTASSSEASSSASSVSMTSSATSGTSSTGPGSSSSASSSSGASSSATSVSVSSTQATTDSSATVSSSTPSLPSSTTTQSTSSASTSSDSSASSSTTQTSSQTTSQPTTLSTLSSSQTSSSSAPTALPTGFRSLGCYTDSNTRLLPTTNGTSSTQTPQLCALACQSRGFKYSGTEYASECWCGNSLPPSSASAPTSQCNMRCSGDSTQTCGAGNRISVVEDTDWQQTFFARQSYSTWNLMGCYVDSGASRTLSKSVSLSAFGGSSNATIANCLEACLAKGFTYCGEEYYSECYGSMAAPTASLAQGVDVLSAGCSFPCTGNQTEACGGSNRIVVYVNNGTSS